MLARWLVTLFLSATLAGGLYAAYYAYLENENAKVNKEALEASLRQLTSLERTLRQQEQQVSTWTNLWKETQAANLMQDKWVVNRLDAARVATWTEVEQLLSFLSNNDPKSTGYWFKPEYFSVARGGAGGTGQANGEQAVAAPGGGAAGDGTYTITAKGEFLIPKM